MDELRFLTGTPFFDAESGTNFAYLRWQAEDPNQLRNKVGTLFGRAGNPGLSAPFSRLTTLQLQTHPAVLSAIVATFPRAYSDPVRLSALLDELFGEFIPAGDLTLGDKLSWLMQAAQADPILYTRVLFLSYAEPVLAVGLGVAAVVPMPASQSTFEIREGNAEASAVIARIFVDTATPQMPPPPPAPIHIENTTPGGHLNAGLRWELTSSLLRASPRIFGFDLIRMDGPFAEAGGYHLSPPNAAELTLLLESHPEELQRVNQGPLLPLPEIPADQPFIIDDNSASLGTGMPFEDGKVVYYFLAARDLLGRIGNPSPGTRVVMCRRHPPESPRRVDVTSVRRLAAGSLPRNNLQISWEAPPGSDTQPPAYYLVYRWNSVAEIQSAAASNAAVTAVNFLNIPHVAGRTRYTYLDVFSGAPSDPVAGQTFLYTVRAVHVTACDELQSADSAPGGGAVRDFSGPATDAATVLISSSAPQIDLSFLQNGTITEELDAQFLGPVGPIIYASIEVNRTHPAISGFVVGLARPKTGGGYETLLLQSGTFTSSTTSFVVNRRIPRVLFLAEENVLLFVGGLDSQGRITFKALPLVELNSDPPAYRRLQADIGIDIGSTALIPGQAIPGGAVHRPAAAGSGTINPLRFQLTVPAEAREYKLYQRVDGGPLQFVEQSTELPPPEDVTEVQVTAFPPYGGEVCYYLQWFDQHGNPSPVQSLGCITIGLRNPLPAPILQRPNPAGDESSPRVRLEWFCQPQGVERFYLFIGNGLWPDAGGASRTPPSLQRVQADFQLPSGLIGTRSEPLAMQPMSSDTVVVLPLPPTLIDDISYYAVRTGRVGGNFGDPENPGVFSLELDIPAGRQLYFFVVAVAASGEMSMRSNIETFQWTAAQRPTLPEIPWPARSLPPVDPTFIPAIQAVNLHDFWRFLGIGVHVGEYVGNSGHLSFGGAIEGDQLAIPTRYDAVSGNSIRLFTNEENLSALPCVLYRYAVDPDTGDPLTGDIIQVTPLIEDLMERSHAGSIEIFNPYIDLFEHAGSIGLYIKDTQPVVVGRSYRYLLVRFGSDGEIDRIVPLPAIIATRPVN